MRVSEDRRHAAMILQGELGPAEQLLWSGAPKKGFLLRPADVLLIPFSLFWTGLALIWEYLALTAGGPFCFPLLGIPFVLIGFHMLLGRFFVDAVRRSRTHYGLTDGRIVILSGLRKRNVETLDLRNLSHIHLTLRKDGWGTITFGPAPLGLWGLATMGWLSFGRDAPSRFELIENARSVYEQILEAQRNLSSAGAGDRSSEL